MYIDIELVFGVIFLVWILFALPLMSRQATDDILPDLPGKKEYQSKTMFYWTIWTLGLVLLILVRWLLTGKFIN